MQTYWGRYVGRYVREPCFYGRFVETYRPGRPNRPEVRPAAKMPATLLLCPESERADGPLFSIFPKVVGTVGTVGTFPLLHGSKAYRPPYRPRTGGRYVLSSLTQHSSGLRASHTHPVSRLAIDRNINKKPPATASRTGTPPRTQQRMGLPQHSHRNPTSYPSTGLLLAHSGR